MATVEKTIKIIFDAEDDTAKAIGSVSRGLGTVASGVETLTSPLASAFDIIAKLNLAFAGLGAAVLAFSVNAAGKAEDAMIELNKVMDDNLDVTDEQKKQIKDLASTYAELGSNTTLSVAEFKRSGFDLQESIGLTEVALKAMNATELDSVEAAELLKRTMSGLAQNYDDAEQTVAAGARIMEVWNNASNIANTTVTEIGESFKQLAPIMEIAGLSFEETSALATTLIESFGEGSEVARGLRTAFLRLADPTAEVSKALKTLNVETKDAEGVQRSVRDILFDVADSWMEVDENSRLALAGQIAGKDQASKFAKVMENFNRVQEINNELKQDTATLDAELAKRMDALSFKLRDLTAAFAGVGVSIGEVLLEGSKDQIESLANLSRAFDGIVTSGGLKPLFDLMTPLMEDFSKTIDTVAENLPEAFKGVDLSPLVESFKLFGSEITSVFEALIGGQIDLETEQGLQNFIQALVNASADFVRVSASMFGSLEDVAAGVGRFIDSLQDMDDETLEAIGGIIGFGKQLNSLVEILPTLGNALLSVGVAFGTYFGAQQLKNMAGVTTAFQGMTVAATGLGKAQQAIGLAAWFEIWRQGIPYLVDYAEKLGLISFTWQDVVTQALDGALTIADSFNLFESYDPNAEAIGLGKELQETLEKARADAIAAAKDNAEPWDPFADFAAEPIEGSAQWLDGLTADLQVAVETTDGWDPFAEWDDSPVESASAAMDAAADATREVEQATDDAGKKGQEFIVTWEDGVKTFTAVGDASESAMKKAGDATDKAKEKTESYHLKLLEIASDERIALRKIEVEFDIAKLEAGTKQVQAAFESVNAGIQSTGELIGSLFETYKGSSLFEKSEIRDQIAAENRRRDQEFEEQKRINDAVIDNYRAQATRFTDGIQIHVDAGTLTPHLQAVLRAMLIDSKIFMNENGAESLLSCG